MQPDEKEQRALLEQVRSMAIIGAKDVAGQPVDRVGRYLMAVGFRLFPVHPVRREVWGIPASKTLSELPEPVDLVVLFRAAAYCPGHAREILALPWRPRGVWMQLGIRSDAARAMLEAEGVTVVENACLMVEHRRLFPAL